MISLPLKFTSVIILFLIYLSYIIIFDICMHFHYLLVFDAILGQSFIL